jgi:hypothetical protein
MWKDSPEERELVTSASYDIVAQIAPEELDLFDELMADYYAKPSPATKGHATDDDPLAFGIEDVMVVATPAVAAMLTTAIGFVIKEVIKATQEESATVITARIRSLFHPETGTAMLAKAELQHIYDIGLETAVDFGLPAEEGKLLAQALLTRFALST